MIPKIEQNLIVNVPASKPSLSFKKVVKDFQKSLKDLQHLEKNCVMKQEIEALKAKMKELENFNTFDVYETVNKPQEQVVIDTEWVIVEKEGKDGDVITKARLCMRGDCEKNRHNIPKESPTVNKITLRLIQAIAASKGLQVNCEHFFKLNP